jgi:hypothetical protein
MDIRSAGILGACVVAAALVVSLIPRGGGPAPAVVRSAEGGLEVDYMVQTSPTTAEGSKLTSVTAIEFHPGYVVVRTREGRGTVFFPERTQRLSWSLAKQ